MSGRLLRIRGLVQGVGFRPYVWRLARELSLRGWVRNDAAGVSVAVDGENLGEFIERLPRELPPLARIDAIDSEAAEVEGLAAGVFEIRDSAGGKPATAIGPDAAVCPACVAEICDPADRRWRYAFTTCTHCGPRFTVSHGIPYDRARTSLAGFPLCPQCEHEYRDPADRRFHAETTCCPACGPQLRLCDAAGQALPGDPIANTLARLLAGDIVALKGLGGFHLACDARNAIAVHELRRRKQREAKPFAVMALNAASLAGLATPGSVELDLFASREAPIVLCRQADEALPGVAPGLAELGLMRPATPLHLLLWHEALGRPAGTGWLQQANELLLVMTSANPHGEPLVIGNDEALQRLAGIADAFLMHDRDIVARCDDAVLRATPAGPAFVRRSRGYAPLPIVLAEDGPPVLALGGYLKNTVCVMQGRQAFLSQHVGSLDNAAAIAFQEEVVAHWLALLELRPAVIAHDLHPDFPSTRLALRLAETWSVPAHGVAHHHAHIAAICAEHGVNERIFGLALDGYGLGPDGGAWGGELLQIDGPACRRLAHLAPLRLPGGERAAREPWRVALAALHDAGLAECIRPWLSRYFAARDAAPLLAMLQRDLRCPPTSSLGRWFDVAAALLGLRDALQFEGQAAMELEALATRHGPLRAPTGAYRLTPAGLDFSPLLPLLLDCAHDPGRGAALFHAAVAEGLAAWVAATVDAGQEGKIALAGGCAMNGVLMQALRPQLQGLGWQVLEARQAPPNDGGLALGQAWLARRLAGASLEGR